MKTREHSDLYLTYDSYKNVLHATRSSNGTDGFLRYLHDDAEHIIREGHNPNVWVSYVHFHDGGDVPDLREAGRHGFFDRVLDTIAVGNAAIPPICGTCFSVSNRTSYP